MSAAAAKARPRYLFWSDIETTGLSPRESEILEIAFVLTRFAYPFERVAEGSYLVSSPGRIELLSGQCSDFIQRMHEESGLRAALADANATRTLPSIEAELLALADAHGWSDDKDERTVIAGSSVGTFDLQFLRARMPRFAARLSHRAFDVSALTLVARSLGMPDDPTEKEAEHRATTDVEGSISLMRRTVEWLAVPDHTQSWVGLVQDTHVEQIDGRDVPIAVLSIERGDLPREGSHVVLTERAT